MRIIAKKALNGFGDRHPDAREALRAWHADVRKACWKSPAEIKRVYANASIIGGNRVVFNIRASEYRLGVAVNWRAGIVFIRFIGTHTAYDRIDAATI